MAYMVTFTINIPPMLAYIPYMDPMGYSIHCYNGESFFGRPSLPWSSPPIRCSSASPSNSRRANGPSRCPPASLWFRCLENHGTFRSQNETDVMGFSREFHGFCRDLMGFNGN